MKQYSYLNLPRTIFSLSLLFLSLTTNAQNQILEDLELVTSQTYQVGPYEIVYSVAWCDGC
ncbi:hypothetical protein E3J79_00540, partial [Candidatus Dependentiae bacterium]